MPPRLACLEVLVREGGLGVDARDNVGKTPLHWASYAESDPIASVDLLVRLGAVVHARDKCGRTQIFESAHGDDDVKLELARRSSPETRRVVLAGSGQFHYGFSAIDFVTRGRRELIAELLVSGASVRPWHAADVLPVAVSHGLPLAAKKEAELAALPPLAHDWRAHEAFVGLALDVKELRAAVSEVEVKKRRVLDLEMELLALGAGTDSSSGSDEE